MKHCAREKKTEEDVRRSAVQVLFQLAEKGDKRDARFDRSKIGFHPNVAEAKASAIAVC